MVNIEDKAKCCGCTACAAICPKDSIEMKEDAEGFLYPSVNADTCINCGACEQVCPLLTHKNKMPFEQRGFIVQNKDAKVLRESTAGGAFTAIAKYAIKRGGVVFGVEFTKDLTAHHVYIEAVSELSRFRNSKYVQSCVGGGTYKQIKFFLKQGRFVCFSGTPCQIEGLKNYLGTEYKNLLTVDVVCRAVPSPMIFRKYLEHQEKALKDKVRNIRFRDKHYGYKYSTINVITDRNQGKYHQGVESDPWLRAFFANICDRPSCHDCQFRNRYRISDFTIWDCFHVGRFSKELDNDKGATRLLVHTKKGQMVFKEVCADFCYVEAKPEELVAGVREMEESPIPNEKRSAFLQDATVLNGTELFEKYFPDTFRVKAERVIRLTCYKLGIYSIMKKLFVKLIGKY